MKRSRSVRLVLLGGAGAFMLTGCDDPVDVATKGQLFTDAQACESAYDQKECLEAYRKAETAHVETAPKFATREQCEAEFGLENCTPAAGQAGSGQGGSGITGSGDGGGGQTAAGGGSWFMPAMMGFMMGRMMSGGYASAPVYRDTQNTVYTGSDRRLGTLNRPGMPPPQRVAGSAGVPKFEMARRQSVSRGGFGRSGYSSSS